MGLLTMNRSFQTAVILIWLLGDVSMVVDPVAAYAINPSSPNAPCGTVRRKVGIYDSIGANCFYSAFFFSLLVAQCIVKRCAGATIDSTFCPFKVHWRFASADMPSLL